MSLSRILFSPITVVLQNKNLSILSEDEYNKKLKDFQETNPAIIQKINPFTIGSFALSVLGTLLALFSEKGGRVFGGLLALIGLGGIGRGVYGTPEIKPDVEIIPENKKEAEQPSSVSLKDLIKIVKDEKKKGKERIEALKEICNLPLEKAREAIKHLVKVLEKCIDENFKNVKSFAKELIKSLGEICDFKKDKKAFEVLKKVVNLEKVEENNPLKELKEKAKQACKQIQERK